MRLKHACIAAASMALLACGDILIVGPQEVVSVDGQLILTVTDTLGVPGFLFAKPAVAVKPSGVVVTSTRYGSLCLNEVSGKAEVTPNTVTVRVKFVERLANCTGEIRILRYRAEVTGLTSKSYTVHVVHEENNRTDTLTTQGVTLP